MNFPSYKWCAYRPHTSSTSSGEDQQWLKISVRTTPYSCCGRWGTQGRTYSIMNLKVSHIIKLKKVHFKHNSNSLMTSSAPWMYVRVSCCYHFSVIRTSEPLQTFSCPGWLGQISLSDKFSHPYRGSLHLSTYSSLFITTVTLPLLAGRILIFSSFLNFLYLYLPSCLHSAPSLSYFCSRF